MSVAAASWPFDQPPNAAAITLRSIAFDGAPILFVSDDAGDHGWQFPGGGTFGEIDAVVVSMEEIVDRDRSVTEIADLPPGWIAWRNRVGDEWRRRQHGE